MPARPPEPAETAAPDASASPAPGPVAETPASAPTPPAAVPAADVGQAPPVAVPAAPPRVDDAPVRASDPQTTPETAPWADGPAHDVHAFSPLQTPDVLPVSTPASPVEPVSRPQQDLAPAAVPLAGPAPGAWPIPQSDFRPEGSVEPARPQDLPAPPVPMAEPGQPEAERAAQPVDVRPQPQQPPQTAAAVLQPGVATALQPPADLAPSPLTGVPEKPAAAPQPQAATTGTTAQPETKVVERVVEQAPAPAPTPHPMTAAAASVIGPITLGTPGPRERRARGWG